MPQRAFAAVALLLAVACSGETDKADAGKVDASGKEAAELSALPQGVLAAVETARPGMTIARAEHETRNDAEYYDIGGTLPDGSEIELDLTKIDGVWTVVEIQRDIAESEAPQAALAALYAERPGFAIVRIIESDQGDGVVIYEFYQDGAGGEREKAEVKVEDGAAEFLTAEWAH